MCKCSGIAGISTDSLWSVLAVRGANSVMLSPPSVFVRFFVGAENGRMVNQRCAAAANYVQLVSYVGVVSERVHASSVLLVRVGSIGSVVLWFGQVQAPWANGVVVQQGIIVGNVVTWQARKRHSCRPVSACCIQRRSR